MVFVKASAVRLGKGDVEDALSALKEYEIPRHLKRVKRLDTDSFLVMISVESSLRERNAGMFDWPGIITVDVPGRAPQTSEQNAECQRYWPCHFHATKESCIDISYVAQMFETVQHLLPPIHACCGVCVIVKDGEVVGTEVDTDDVLGHCVLKSVSAVSKQGDGYLCTGLDAFVYREPCVSCAMAFVHGRIRRVFFCKEIEKGPYTHHKLCYNKNINHRYTVYRITTTG